ncbi:ADP-ribosylglycohydrolase family protein [Shewanella sp. OPT22]|nr:ADP-ribosylglycohydrolase family protein [Shewanella sp. OPT22]
MDALGRTNTMIMAAFYGDAFALGPHWIYDPAKIKDKFGHITEVTAPLPDSYHKGKCKGDFTHYGDLMLFMLKHLHKNNGFELQTFKTEWCAFITQYQGYIDGASKKTLENIAANHEDPVGSQSNDLAGAAFFALLFSYYAEQEMRLSKVTELTTALHNHPDVTDAVIYFAKVALNMLSGRSIADALLNQYHSLPESTIKSLIHKGIDAKEQDSQKALSSFGVDCSINSSLPGVIQILLKHENDFNEAMTQNVMAGGDSAARGIIIASLLSHQVDLNSTQFHDVNAYQTILNNLHLS